SDTVSDGRDEKVSQSALKNDSNQSNRAVGSRDNLPPTDGTDTTTPTKTVGATPQQNSKWSPPDSRFAPIGYTGQNNPLLHALPEEQSGEADRTSTTSEIRLVDPNQAQPQIRLAEQRRQPVPPGTRTPIDDTLPTTSSTLTAEQRKQIEKVGREIVLLELQRRGFDARGMSEVNEGYDIFARKDNQEYHIEVKSHRLGASKITLTRAEYLEYAKQTEGGYKWQLWHVQYLEEGNRPQITIYTQIPAEALQERSFSVDLAMCWGEDAGIQTED
ncbi:MAG: DUF3883 domain-containing protein, partial [Fimbriimonadales bacterium]|nr:DUF3883 domain-containing protein [Fimbriimonadales bacterium]